MLKNAFSVFLGRNSDGSEPLPRAIRTLFFVRLINAMGNFVFPFLTMLLTMKLGYTKAEAGVFMSVTALISGIGLLVGGKIADLFGRKRTIATLQLSAALLLGTCAALGLVPTVPYIMAAAYVLIQASWPVFNALVADIAPPSSRKRAYAMLYWGNNIGYSIGPIMAGYLFNAHASYMFIGNAVSLSVVSLILIFGVRASRDQLPANASELKIETECGDEAPEDCSLFRSLLKRPLLLAFAATNLLLYFVYGQHQFGLPVFLNDVLGEKGPSTYGMVMTTNGLTVVICTGLISALLAKTHAGMNMGIAAVFYAAGFGMLFFCASPLAVVISTVVWTIGEVISATNSQVFIASLTPSSHRGRVNAFVSFVSGWGSTIAPVLSGVYVERFGSRELWPFIASVSLIAAVLMALIAKADTRRRAN